MQQRMAKWMHFFERQTMIKKNYELQFLSLVKILLTNDIKRYTYLNNFNIIKRTNFLKNITIFFQIYSVTNRKSSVLT